MAQLFSPIKFRQITLRNRIAVSPMCQYSAPGTGVPNDWHVPHRATRAVGGAGLVIVEATGVNAVGRISPADLGLWNDAQEAGHARLVRAIAENGAVPGIQLAHAGRKASTAAPWEGGRAVPPEKGGWTVVGPSAIAFDAHSPVPVALTAADLEQIKADFVQAVHRSHRAGYKVVELHMAHGYLLHEFLSPLSNRRTDAFGGDFDGRTRFPLEIVRAARAHWPAELPLFVRISATDWKEGGWDLPQSIAFSKKLKELGVDLVDCSSGGLVHDAKIPVGLGFQVPFAQAIRAQAGIATGAVGLITGAAQAEAIVASGQADLVLLARELLRNPYWPLHAARELRTNVAWPNQYLRAKPSAL